MYAIGKDVSKHVKQIEGASYIPWVAALQLSDWPAQDVVNFGPPHGAVRPLFGGGMVAVDMPVCSGGPIQRMYHPILDMRSQAMPYKHITSRDVGDAINRCRAKLAAAVTGIGLCLWADMTAAASFVKQLGVNEATKDLSKVTPFAERKKDRDGKPVGHPFLGWYSALAAARITDPSFSWSVVEFEDMDPNTGAISSIPALRVPGKGWMVAVDSTWKGRSHREFLPIMGFQEVQTRNGPKMLDHQPLPDPNISDWHRAVMRCLAKSIALVTGYGLSLYADELAVAVDPAAMATSTEIEDLITQTGAERSKLLNFYGLTSLEGIDEVTAQRVLAGLRAKAKAMGVGSSQTAPASNTPVAATTVAEGGDAPEDGDQACSLQSILKKAASTGVDPMRLKSFIGGKALEDASEAELETLMKKLLAHERNQKARRERNAA